MKLTAQNVDSVFSDCLHREGEQTTLYFLGQGVMYRAGFHLGRLKDHSDDILSMLDELPLPFMEEHGGGWSFLNACMTKDGVQWGEHRNVDQLITLGNAIGKVRFNLPRDLWGSLPNGMPYFCVLKKGTL